MSNRYVVTVFDCCGEYRSVACGTDFWRAVEVSRELARRYLDKRVLAFNAERADGDDGLSERQRRIVEAAATSRPRVKRDPVPEHWDEAKHRALR